MKTAIASSLRRGIGPLAALLLLAGCGGSGGSDPPALRVGYAEIDITPERGTVLGGFGYPGGTRRATGVHDPLLGQAVLFENAAGDAFLLITLDVAGYFYDFGDWGPGVAALRERIVAAMQDRVRLEPEHVLVETSHTHAGTDLIGFWQAQDQGPDQALLAWHQQALTELAVAAADDLQPASLWLGHTELPGVARRDGPCSEVVDHSVEIAEVRAPDGTPRVTMAHYALHATLSGYDNTELSSDFVWGFRETLRERTGAAGVFLLGPIAAVHDNRDAVPGEGWERVFTLGEMLAEVVLAEAPRLVPSGDEVPIEHRFTRYSCAAEGEYLTLVQEFLQIPKRYFTREGEAYIVTNLEVCWHRLGPLEIVGWPGEPTPEYGLMLEQRMASPFRMALSHANDAIGYLIDPESIEKDTSGQLQEYELQMGPGRPGGPCAWEATAAMGWFVE